jgi:tetratricopeptide (TPR) repeat protein
MIDRAPGRRESNRAKARVVGMGGVFRLQAALAAAALLVAAAGCALLPGQSGSGSRTVRIVSHVVSDGETLETIAADYYGTARAAGYLADVNDLTPGYLPEVGSMVDVPVSEADLVRYERRTEAKILYNEGTLLAEAGDYPKAQEKFAASLRADPRFADAGYNLGVVLLASDDPKRAAAVLEQVLLLTPDDELSVFALGKAYFDDGRFDDALSSFDQAIDMEPGLEEARFARAVTLLKLGERDDGIHALDQYLRLFPDGVWADSARAELTRLAAETPGR